MHGTPESDMLSFLETVTPDGLREASREEIIQRTGMVDAKFILCGHTHLPREVRLNHGCLIVNPGCVGLPAYADDMPHPHIIENRTPHARYAILEKTDKSWNADLSSSNMTGSSLLRLLSAMVVRIGGSAFLRYIAGINSTVIHHLLTDSRFCTKYADIFRVSLREK